MAKVKVASVNEVPEGSLKKVEVNGEVIALFKIDGKIYATSNICTHEHCELDHNYLMHQDVVECSCHGSQFKVATGEVVLPPAIEPLKTYKLTIEDDEIFIEN